jgi:hypothetical protein
MKYERCYVCDRELPPDTVEKGKQVLKYARRKYPSKVKGLPDGKVVCPNCIRKRIGGAR